MDNRTHYMSQLEVARRDEIFWDRNLENKLGV